MVQQAPIFQESLWTLELTRNQLKCKEKLKNKEVNQLSFVLFIIRGTEVLYFHVIPKFMEWSRTLYERGLNLHLFLLLFYLTEGALYTWFLENCWKTISIRKTIKFSHILHARAVLLVSSVSMSILVVIPQVKLKLQIWLTQHFASVTVRRRT